jgi:hypothetical protein
MTVPAMNRNTKGNGGPIAYVLLLAKPFPAKPTDLILTLEFMKPAS